MGCNTSKQVVKQEPGQVSSTRNSLPAKNKLSSMVHYVKEGDGELLWGLLHIKIIKCEKLRDRDDASNLLGAITKGTADKSDPYVEAYVQDYRLLKTRCYEDDLNPVFNEEFFCPVAHYTDCVTFKVMDKDMLVAHVLGQYDLPVSELIKHVDETDLKDSPNLSPRDLKRVGVHKTVELSAEKIRDRGTLEFMIEFIPTRLLPKTPEVPGLYFSPTKCNDVKLYMNADDDGSAPVVRYGGQNDDEKVWKPPRMWRDVFDAMCDAKQFIYAVGWSFDTDQYLLRGEELDKALADNKYSPKLGELLKIKAEEGIVVNLMQWDDFSSNLVKETGKMGTHDEKTRKCLHGSKVNARFMSMVGEDTGILGGQNSLSNMLQGTNKTMAFTHHQKFIIMDAPKLNGEGRELRAFVGGIDLTEGRWDNRQVRFMISISLCCCWLSNNFDLC